MDQNAEYAMLIGNREELYLLLGRLYKLEVDESLLERLAEMQFPKNSGDAELNEGYQLLTNYLKHQKNETDLAVDYARVFLGAGIYSGLVAHPYESVYTSPERLVMQEAWVDVVATYHANGLDKAASLDIPEDHIALECEFMAYLCHKIQQAMSKDDWSTITRAIDTQKEFLQKHLLNWVPNFCEDIQRCASSDFYKAVAKITDRFLKLDLDILEELSPSTAVLVNPDYQNEQLNVRI
ncbi:molecular chaperone TorD family protein [Shewanella yunxiaonensis]|uniref:Molecular chaperone TorD family protein n=1 Tax=Shewanella yunxiaonensis TaxID=2829809 RepID=A0ABX7YXT9_9GAMM|nr:molecular chaperone TorD family protein [Shewanella yunxiaonensis]QUN07099.1 molecular chaperone TorD family protein [Shewanella yunxiaonensis]